MGAGGILVWSKYSALLTARLSRPSSKATKNRLQTEKGPSNIKYGLRWTKLQMPDWNYANMQELPLAQVGIARDSRRSGPPYFPGDDRKEEGECELR